MITPSQHPSSRSAVRVPANAPYAGPERRVADRRRSPSSSSRTFGVDALGPYLPDRLHVLQQHLAQIDGIVESRDVSSDVVGEASIAAETSAMGPAPSTLPWISSFLDDEGAEEPVSVEERFFEAVDDEPSWSLDAAASEMQRLATTLGPGRIDTADTSEPVRVREPFADEATVARPVPMSMWRDDDFVDVMPVLATKMPVAAEPAVDARPSSLAPTFSSSAASTATMANEAAASALESVAQRVRAGELSVNGFNAALGEAAALASTLAALLGARG